MTESVRQRRSDAGTIRLMPRDIQALTFIEDMRAIYDSDLAILLERIGGRAVGLDACRAVVRRWERLGLATSARILVGGPRVIQVTQAGARLVAGDVSVTPVAVSQIEHTCLVARLRLVYEAEHAGVRWTSERRLIRDGWTRILTDGTSRTDPWSGHRPDAIATSADSAGVELHEAVEVELHAKSGTITDEIVTKLMTDPRLDAVAYWCGDDGVADHVARRFKAVRDEVAAGKRHGRFDSRPVRLDVLPDTAAVPSTKQDQE